MSTTSAKSVNEPPTGRPPEEWWRDVHMQQILISAIVHDIKTPLRYFIWTARSLQQDLQRGTCPETLLERASLMYSSAERMHGMVEDLLQYSRLQLSAGHAGQIRTVNLHLAVAAKVEVFEAIARAKEVRIDNRVDPGLSICTDPDCLAVILHNVLDNAVKFTPGGRVRISSRVGADSVQLEVSDTGRGMSREYIDWCNTEAIYTSGILPGEDFRPSGLGLLLVRELLGKIKGRLQVTRGTRSGTIMLLEFPIACTKTLI
jgi:K+-sensing histidine kinase KdpD